MITADHTRVQLVPVDTIIRGNNDRQAFGTEDLTSLAQSIQEHADLVEQQTGEKFMGLIQPVRLRLLPDGTCRIVAGERRTRAIRDVLGWRVVPAIVQVMSDRQESGAMLVENINRVDLNPVEEAEAYDKRLRPIADGGEGWSMSELVEATGKSKDLIERRISLLSLHPDIQHLVRHGHMPLGHAEAMTILDNHRQLMAMRIFQSGKSVPLRTFTKVVSDLYEEQSQDSLFDLEAFWSQEVQKPEPVYRGKKTSVPVVTTGDIPAVPLRAANIKGENASRIIMRYVAHLLGKGHTHEAAVVGTLYETLVQFNFLKLPPGATLDDLAQEAEEASSD